MDIYQVIREPHVTEKATYQKQGFNQITLKVHKEANKVEIRRAVEVLFKTKVLEVKTMKIRGKQRRVGRNVGRRADWKKAVVRLKAGEHIEFFEGL